ncbi:hypothetical protein J6590_088046 [Homalodisca vitripennis]|nr:hypothetical protein J6590_088046 [Homalodisca vitripennis]
MCEGGLRVGVSGRAGQACEGCCNSGTSMSARVDETDDDTVGKSQGSRQKSGSFLWPQTWDLHIHQGSDVTAVDQDFYASDAQEDGNKLRDTKTNIKDKLLLGTTVIAEEHCNSVASPHARARQLIDNGIVIMGSRGDQGVAHLHFHIPSKCSALHQLFLSRSRSRDNQRLLRCQSAVTLVHLG